MSQANVDHLIEQIQKLSDEDRSLFHQRLAELDEIEWEHELAEARRIAAEQGIDEAAIDRAVAKVRYGK